MLILPGALPVAPIPEQAFAVPSAPSPVKIVAPVSQSEKARNETGQQAGNQSGAALPPPPNPDELVGPTPAFEANMLESEREKLRAGPAPEAAEPDKSDQAEMGETGSDKTEAGKATAPEQYAKAPEPETHKVDIML